MDIFKIFDSLAQAYAKDIDGYKEIIKAVEAMMDQKEIALQDIKDKSLVGFRGLVSLNLV